eukprot:6195267-Pleurochrysis_carterae.AAC.2
MREQRRATAQAAGRAAAPLGGPGAPSLLRETSSARSGTRAAEEPSGTTQRQAASHAQGAERTTWAGKHLNDHREPRGPQQAREVDEVEDRAEKS